MDIVYHFPTMNPNRKNLCAGLALCALFVASCAQRGAPFSRYAPIPEGRGRLYLYVEPATVTAFLPSLSLLLDGRPLPTLESGDYVTLTLVPGEHLLVADPSLNVVGHSSQITRNVQIFVDEPMFCGYFPAATEGQGRLRCSSEPARHELMKQCRLAPFEADSPWQP
jgi:hypothetical protein